MKIAIASDHCGFLLKEKIIKFLENKDLTIKDFGSFSEKSVDYPDFALELCNSIITKKADLGILICGTGIGMSISANKINGILCALCNDTYSAKMAKCHNNANILAIGAKIVSNKDALNIVNVFIKSIYEGERHQIRLNKIMNIENLNKR